MQYRQMTKDKLNVSLLGLGCMRFPILEGNNSKINEEYASKMVQLAIDKGINYFDTAYPYHDGNSEGFMGRALEGTRRSDYYLATKSPVWLLEKKEDFMVYLDEQLVNLKTNYVDFYLFHALNEKSFKKIISLEFENFIDEAKSEGKIRYIGFSFHDDLPVFKRILDHYPWDFCQIQLNYIDTEYQAGLEGLDYARKKGVDVVVMEPLKGGKLALSPDDVLALFKGSENAYTPVQWALKWLYSLEGISVVLSGMSDYQQMYENIETTSEGSVLKPKDMDTIRKAAQIYMSRTKVDCTGCKYCLPCPQDVAIPDIFQLYNDANVFGTLEQSKKDYHKLSQKGLDSSKCVECGLCEEKCPQNLSIIQYLKDSHKELIK